MLAWMNRLSFKLTLATLLFVVLPGLASALIIAGGFWQAQRNATARSAEGLEKQGGSALQRLVQREASASAAQLGLATAASRQAADYLLAVSQGGHAVPYDPSQLRRGGGGQWYDPRPGRVTDVFIPSRVAAIDPELARDLRDSAALDALFPALKRQYPAAAAIYFISPNQLIRYHPPITPTGTLPADYDISADPVFSRSTPQANPGRGSVWRLPYIDPLGQGPLVSALTPVYEGETFRGVIGVDVSLSSLIDNLATLRPTPGSYAFLIDQSGQLIAAAPGTPRQITGAASLSPNPTLGQPINADPSSPLGRALAAMRRSESGVAQLELGQQPVFLAYAPLLNVSWSLGIAVPISELTSQSAVVAREIENDAAATVRWSLLALAVCFVLAWVGMTLLNRRWLARPISALMEGTRAIRDGDLRVTIPVRSHDELGQLADSFNKMAREQRVVYETLEQRVAERTHELSTLLNTSRNLTSTLELGPLLDMLLQQLGTILEYQGVAVFQREGSSLMSLLVYRGPLAQEQLYHQLPLAPLGPEPVPLATLLERVEDESRAFGQEVLASGEPLLIPDLQADTPVARAYRRRLSRLFGEPPAHIRTLLGVPLLQQGRVFGVITLSHQRPDAYDQHQRDLVLAFANQAASAIHNAQLYEQAQAAARKTAALAKIASSMAFANPLETTLDHLARSVVQALELCACLVLLMDERERWVRVIGIHGFDERFARGLESCWRAGAPLRSAQAFRERRAVVLDNARQAYLDDPRFAGIHAMIRADEWEAGLYVPLIVRGRAVGALSGFYPRRRLPLPTEIDFMMAVADHAAVAIENARLITEAQGKAALEERQRLARELHDSVSQALYGIALGARTARTLLDRDPQRVAEPIDYVLGLAEAGLAEMRALIFELRPESLEQEGLVVALTKQADSLRARYGLELRTALGEEPDAPLPVKEALYRIGQEALHNVVKHARARHVDLLLHADAHQLTLEVRDDGVGFDPGGSFPGHLGLRSMHERATQLGGTLAYESAPGQGTTLRAYIPTDLEAEGR